MAGDFEDELGSAWDDEWLDIDLDLIYEVIEDFIDDAEAGGYI